MQIYWNIKKAGRKVRPECEIIATNYNKYPNTLLYRQFICQMTCASKY